ncbi:hypothetical protein BGZ82_005319 [Podila clonocystis]|nr:hypothetical protein BGZ82_005319 [Podila clonocystis]
MRHKYTATVLVPTPLRHEINYEPKSSASKPSTPRSVPVPTLIPPKANKPPKPKQRPKTNAKFRVVEGQLYRFLVQQRLKIKINASESNDCALLDLPEIDFFCIQCMEPSKDIPAVKPTKCLKCHEVTLCPRCMYFCIFRCCLCMRDAFPSPSAKRLSVASTSSAVSSSASIKSATAKKVSPADRFTPFTPSTF